MIPIGSLTKKTVLILTLLTLTIGLGTSLEWESPTQDSYNTAENIEVSVSGTNADNVTLQIDGPTSDIRTKENVGDQTYVNWTLTTGDTVNGDYDLTINDSAGGQITKSITLDGENPSVTIQGNAYVKSDPTISVEVKDQYTNIVSAEASADNGASISNVEDISCSEGNTCTVDVEVDTSSVESGETFNLDVNATDEEGNTGSDSKDFTLDTSYKGDSSPSISLANFENSIALISGEDEATVDIDISDEGDNTDIRAKCMVNGDDLSTSDYETPGDDTEFSCDIPVDEYSGTIDFQVKLCDRAGNCGDTVSKQFILDLKPPVIDKVEQPNGVSTFNSNFQLSYTAYDSDGSGISKIEYFFDKNTDYGSGTQIEQDDSSKFTVDTSNLDRGSKTVYLRAKDGAGRWSDVSKFNFEFYPNKAPKLSLSAPKTLKITSGNSKSFTLTVENTGEFYIKSAEITGSTLISDSVLVTDLAQDSSVQKTVEVNTSGQEVGVYNLTLSSNNYDASTTVEVTLRATQEQKQSINQSLQNWIQKKQALMNNVSEISTVETDNGNITQFTNTVEKAQEAAQNGKYYQVKSYLQNIESEFDTASSTYSEGLEEHQKKMRNRLFMFAIAGIVILGGGVAGFFLYREESLEADEITDISTEGFMDKLPDNLPGSLPEIGVMEKIRGVIGEEEEEEEVGYTFEDFT